MQKTVISFFFLTLAAFILFSSSRSVAQNNLPEWKDNFGQILIPLDSGLMALKRGDLDLNGLHFDSSLQRLKKFQWQNTPTHKYYFPKDGERYYLDIIPPHRKGTQVDHSKIWLLKEEVAASCH